VRLLSASPLFLFTHTIFVSFPSQFFFIVYGLSKEKAKELEGKRSAGCFSLSKAPHELLDKQKRVNDSAGGMPNGA
jgi:hypothetical protein